MPDVLGTVKVENLKVLQKLADKINADAVAAKQPDPKYVAYLEDGNDIRGIDNGFLVKSSKVKVIETKALGGTEKLNYGTGFPDEKLFDRPPFLLKAEVADAKLGKPFAFTVIVNHFKSYRGIDDEKDGDRVRNKRRLEAEWLANFIAERGKADPTERMLVCGDFKACQFNDGYNDLIGFLNGKIFFHMGQNLGYILISEGAKSFLRAEEPVAIRHPVEQRSECRIVLGMIYFILNGFSQLICFTVGILNSEPGRAVPEGGSPAWLVFA